MEQSRSPPPFSTLGPAATFQVIRKRSARTTKFPARADSFSPFSAVPQKDTSANWPQSGAGTDCSADAGGRGGCECAVDRPVFRPLGSSDRAARSHDCRPKTESCPAEHRGKVGRLVHRSHSREESPPGSIGRGVIVNQSHRKGPAGRFGAVAFCGERMSPRSPGRVRFRRRGTVGRRRLLLAEATQRKWSFHSRGSVIGQRRT